MFFNCHLQCRTPKKGKKNDNMPDIGTRTSESEQKGIFDAGDHIYKWNVFPISQTHAIVMSCNPELLIVTKLYSKSGSFGNIIDLIEVPANRWHNWHKVKYNASFLTSHLYFSGTCSCMERDFNELVLSRVRFLILREFLLPKGERGYANSECLAVWCSTGHWLTLQASSFLHATMAGQAKSTATLALYASNQTVTVPASGMWGYFGYTTKVSLLSAQPMILPALASYGLVTIGAPWLLLKKYRKRWKNVTAELNNEFWSSAEPSVFVKCLEEWSNIQIDDS